MKRLRLVFAILFCAAAFTSNEALAQASDEKKPGPLPRKAKKAETKGATDAPFSAAPAPTTGSMPKGGPTPSGKLGTEPTAKGKLGTEPKPGDPQSRPPRPQ
jgi:hypothetical protein